MLTHDDVRPALDEADAPLQRTVGRHSHERVPAPLPPIAEGHYTLTFARGEGPEFALLLGFPGPRGPRYPIGGLLTIAEFRMMLTALADATRPHAWDGRHFFGYVRAATSTEPAEVWFYARHNGIQFSFSVEEWRTVCALFDRAWARPDVRAAWDRWSCDDGAR